jgi:hypothetical protein
MATALLIEEERGTYTGHYHAHNGYYAGDFSRRQEPESPATRSHTRPSLRVADRRLLPTYDVTPLTRS